MRIYTRTGDRGQTSLWRGQGLAQRVPKDHGRVRALGSVDEANASLGLAKSLLPASEETVRQRLTQVQHDLFAVGAELASGQLAPSAYRVRPEDVTRLEAWIDEETSRLPPLRSFVLPDGVPGAAALHVARTVVRRAEREVVALIRQEEASSWNPATSAYLNRLSDLLFVWARGVNVRAAFPETLTSAQARGEPPA